MRLSLRRLVLTVFVAACGAAGARAGISTLAKAPAAVAGDADLHLLLNVAANRLDVYEHGKRTHTYKVSVGMRGYETPGGEYNIGEVTWNPWWHPPASPWARDRKVEPPGAKNPMGRVKLNFAPLLYIHGTPEQQSLGQPASRGCVRMRNAEVIELAQLVHTYATPKLSSSVLEQLIGSPTLTRRIILQKPVRLTAIYQVAAVTDGFLVIYPDVYSRVGAQLRDQVELVLEENGIDLRRVNQQRLERLLEKGGTRRVSMSLDSLTARGAESR
jgi:murein L,D-transpeptidase YcbB/YkuD